MTVWYADAAARRFALRFIPLLALPNLAWEAAHIRLYTLWAEGPASYLAFAVLHCTVGDVLVGMAALLLALFVSGGRRYADWRPVRLATLVTLFGVGYTIFSEWMNVELLRSWAYVEAMPRLAIGGFELGLSPLVQWLTIPPLAIWTALRTGDRK